MPIVSVLTFIIACILVVACISCTTVNMLHGVLDVCRILQQTSKLQSPILGLGNSRGVVYQLMAETATIQLPAPLLTDYNAQALPVVVADVPAGMQHAHQSAQQGPTVAAAYASGSGGDNHARASLQASAQVDNQLIKQQYMPSEQQAVSEQQQLATASHGYFQQLPLLEQEPCITPTTPEQVVRLTFDPPHVKGCTPKQLLSVAFLPVDPVTGRRPPLCYICRANNTWFALAAELVRAKWEAGYQRHRKQLHQHGLGRHAEVKLYLAAGQQFFDKVLPLWHYK